MDDKVQFGNTGGRELHPKVSISHRMDSPPTKGTRTSSFLFVTHCGMETIKLNSDCRRFAGRQRGKTSFKSSFFLYQLLKTNSKTVKGGVNQPPKSAAKPLRDPSRLASTGTISKFIFKFYLFKKTVKLYMLHSKTKICYPVVYFVREKYLPVGMSQIHISFQNKENCLCVAAFVSSQERLNINPQFSAVSGSSSYRFIISLLL